MNIPLKQATLEAIVKSYGKKVVPTVKADGSFDWGYPAIAKPTEQDFVDNRLAGLKILKSKEIADARYNAEVGGIEVEGVSVRTDRVTQSILGNARQYAKEDETFSTDWKLSDGLFITLTATQIIAFADAVLAHVKAQFTKEKLLNDQITAATTPAEVQAIAW